jgi:hypothetical protein
MKKRYSVIEVIAYPMPLPSLTPPARSAAPPRYPNFEIDHKRAKEIQKKLGLKDWDDPER